MEEIKEKINGYLLSHLYLRLATINAAGTPQVHTVGYVSDGATVYFVTDKKSHKAVNIMANPNVAYSVDENYEKLSLIQGVQMEGTATLVTDAEEADQIDDLMAEEFPGLADLPPNPDLVFFRIDPKEAYFIDCTVSFGHRDKVTY